MSRAAVLLTAFLSGCAAYPEQPAVTSWGAPQASVLLTVQEVRSEADVEALCPDKVQSRACSIVRTVGNVNFCLVTYAAPKDFNDVNRLADVGHEIMHCLGRMHR